MFQLLAISCIIVVEFVQHWHSRTPFYLCLLESAVSMVVQEDWEGSGFRGSTRLLLSQWDFGLPAQFSGSSCDTARSSTLQGNHKGSSFLKGDAILSPVLACATSIKGSIQVSPQKKGPITRGCLELGSSPQF